MKKLIIVESPAKIKTISKFLGKDFVIMSTMGHIKDLPQKELGVSIDDGQIHIDYVPLEGKAKTIAEICKAAQSADTVFLAPDPDREGEIIAWHTAQEIKKVLKKPENINRITFNEITKPAILEAIAHPGSIDEKKVAAQQARRVLDRWVGYEVSPVLWRKLTRGLSAGRVQSVALRLICDREDAIRSFKTEEYWTIDGIFVHDDVAFSCALALINNEKPVIADKKTATSIVTGIKKENYVIDSIVDKKRTRNPSPPFMTSTLQQEAYNKLGFAVKKTMMLAQQLYEGVPLEDPKTPVALITYMRTDSLRLSDTALKQAHEFIKNSYAKEYLPNAPIQYEKKKKKETNTAAQDAHEAIRPIDVYVTPEKISRYISGDLAKLYELIWKRFVSCQMTPALYAQRQVSILGGPYLFKVTGSTLLFDGFLKLYTPEDDEKEEKVVLPQGIKAKQKIDLTKVDPKQHFTQPPPRYNEASLVKELEKEGIGRPSTYATILNTIRERSYTTLEKKRFMPTELGMAVTKLLIENLPQIMDLKFTALMEQDLDKIAQGELDRDKLLKKFYKAFQADLKKFIGSDGKGKAVQPTDVECPECHKNKLGIRFGKTGEFLGCMGYPECSFTSNFTRDEQGNITLVKAEPPKLLDEKCPQCGSPMRIIRGRYGEFTACSNYPKCKYIKPTTAGFTCPLCKKGAVIQKAWRGGKFWGCANYPECKFAVFSAIKETPCPTCHWPFMMINKEGKETCANKECPSNQKN